MNGVQTSYYPDQCLTIIKHRINLIQINSVQCNKQLIDLNNSYNQLKSVEKSVYNFKDDGTLITMPENILISNVKPRTSLHVKYLTPLMHYQMSSKQKPDILILGNLKDADAYSKLAQTHEYASNIPTLDDIVQISQLNKVDLNLYTEDKPHIYFYAVPSSSDPSNVAMRVLTRTVKYM